MSIANDEQELRAALEAAAREGSRILIEQTSAAARCRSASRRQGPAQHRDHPGRRLYDYRNKYQPGAAKEITPAEIPAETEKRWLTPRFTVFHALNLSAYSRAVSSSTRRASSGSSRSTHPARHDAHQSRAQGRPPPSASATASCASRSSQPRCKSESMTGYCVSDIAAITGGVLSVTAPRP